MSLSALLFPLTALLLVLTLRTGSKEFLDESFWELARGEMLLLLQVTDTLPLVTAYVEAIKFVKPCAKKPASPWTKGKRWPSCTSEHHPEAFGQPIPWRASSMG